MTERAAPSAATDDQSSASSSRPRELPRLLCVDDEQHVLDALRRTLRGQFDITTADRASRALGLLHAEGPFDVVLSDLRMPLMNGIELLHRIHLAAPDTARVLLTGNTDLNAAIEAVNRGQLHRFLVKPCPPDELVQALTDAVAIHRRQVSERNVLDQTLRASVEALLEVLALANPQVFARATRISELVRSMVRTVAAPGAWEIEVAAMLSQLGALALPEALQDKLHRGMALTPGERKLVALVPVRSVQLLAHVPRLELVRESITFQFRGFDGSGHPEDGPSGTAIPLGARMLRVATDFDALLAQGLGPGPALATLESRAELYDPELLKAVETTGGGEKAKRVSIRAVPPDGVLAADVRDVDGMLLVGAGQRLSPMLVARLASLADVGQAAADVWIRSAG